MTEKPDIPANDTVEALRLDRQLCFALYGAANRVTRLYRPLLDVLGLTYPQYLAMLVLWEATPRTVGALGEALDLESSTLTPLLKRLESQGLLVRARDPKDERRVVVALTDAGKALRERARNIPEQLFCKLNMQLDALGDLRDQLKTVAV